MIHIPDEKYQLLSEQAAAAGFENVAAYVEALAEDAAFDARCGMSDKELRQSAADCNRINERMKVEGGRDAHEALTELGHRFGDDTPT